MNARKNKIKYKSGIFQIKPYLEGKTMKVNKKSIFEDNDYVSCIEIRFVKLFRKFGLFKQEANGKKLKIEIFRDKEAQ